MAMSQVTFRGDRTASRRPFIKGAVAGVLESALMAILSRYTMNTSATSMRLCANESIGSICLNRNNGR